MSERRQWESQTHCVAVHGGCVIVARGNCAVVAVGSQHIAQRACQIRAQWAHKGTCTCFSHLRQTLLPLSQLVALMQGIWWSQGT
jgi:hypothetical protein